MKPAPIYYFGVKPWEVSKPFPPTVYIYGKREASSSYWVVPAPDDWGIAGLSERLSK